MPLLRPLPHLPAWPPNAAWRRRAQLALLIVAVGAVHLAMIGPMSAPLGRQPGRPPAMQVVLVPPVAAPRVDEAVPATPAEPAPLQPPALLAAPPPDPAVRPEPAEQRPVDWLAGPQAPEAVAGTAPEPESAVVAAADAASAAPMPGDTAGALAADGGGPPPTYATSPSREPLKLDYRIERGDEAGTGQLSYEWHEGGQYRARFYGVVSDKALMDWVSRGGFNTAGLAPNRMVERQRGVEVRAVNFQRDQGVISFSGSTRAHALHAGAQDRVSVLWQLPAIARASPGGLQAGQKIRIQVAGTRGQVDDWRFEVTGAERLMLGGAPVETLHLVREPDRPYDQRVEVWLAPQAGQLPVGLRFTLVPGRSSLAYWLSGPLPAPETPKPDTPAPPTP